LAEATELTKTQEGSPGEYNAFVLSNRPTECAILPGRAVDRSVAGY
jgi:hypothetical protein